MDDFDLYGDLELLHEEEKQNAIEDLKWKDKYKAALITIEKLQADNKELKKKIKNLETNFASLFDTARAEIKRKDNLITELRKQKDDICFRRSKPVFNEEARGTPKESGVLNPFSGQSRKPTANPISCEKSEQFSDDKKSFTLENGKRKYEYASYRDKDQRNSSHERDQNRDRHRDRSKDRSRHRNRSRDRRDKRGRSSFNDRCDKKYRDRSEDRNSNRSKDRFSRRDDKEDDKKRKDTKTDAPVTKSSDGNWNKYDKRNNYTNEDKNAKHSTNTEKGHEKQENPLKSNTDHLKNKTNNSTTELNKPYNTPCSQSEKRVSPKIEILQIEVLNDVKEFKKNKLESENKPKPEPIDPAKAAIEKTNEFLEALFDDSILNKNEDSTNDLYDDLLFCTEKLEDSIKRDNKKENPLNRNENFDSQTPQREINTKNFEDLFGPSPAGSLCTVERKENSTKSVQESSTDSDFVLITKTDECLKDIIQPLPMPSIAGMIIDDCDNQNENSDIKCSEVKTSSGPNVDSAEKNKPASEKSNEDSNKVDDKKLEKIDENFNFKQQTPQRQQTTKLMIDLFGPSPALSVGGHKSSVTSMDESSSDFYFEPNIKSIQSTQNEKNITVQNSPNPPIIVDDNCTDKIYDEINKEQQKLTLDKQLNGNVSNNVKPFAFVELDSSFYSSDEENSENLKASNITIESPPFENIITLKEMESSEKEKNNIGEVNTSNTSEKNLNTLKKSEEVVLPQSKDKETSAEKFESTQKNEEVVNEFKKTCEALCPENQNNRRTHHSSSEKSNYKNDLRSKISKHKSNTHHYRKSSSDENEHRSNSSKNDKEKRRYHHSHHEHHHRDKDRSKYSKHDSLERGSRRHGKTDRHSSKQDKYESERRNPREKSSKNSKNDTSEPRCSPLLVYYDDDSVKDNPQNPKVSDQDQVFFLHCDDISSDDEIIGEKSSPKDESSKENNDKCEETGITHENEKEIKSTNELSSTKVNNDSENFEVVNGVESNEKDVYPNHIIINEIVDLDEPATELQEKDPPINPSGNVEEQTTSSDMTVESNTKTNENICASSSSQEICQINTSSYEGHNLKNIDEGSKNENNLTENGEQGQSESKDDITAPESSNKTDEVVQHKFDSANEDKIQVESSTEACYPMQSVNQCVESYEAPNEFIENQTIALDNTDRTEEIPKGSCNNLITLTNENQRNGSEINFDTSPKKIEVTPERIQTKELPSEKKIHQNFLQLSNFFSPQISPPKSNNSADEIESSHSNSDLLSSGRRKKIKTPRKHTNVCDHKDISNEPISNGLEPTTLQQTESSLKECEESFILISPNKNMEEEMPLPPSVLPDVKDTSNLPKEDSKISDDKRSESPLKETNNSSSESFPRNQMDKLPSRLSTADENSLSVSSQDLFGKEDHEILNPLHSNAENELNTTKPDLSENLPDQIMNTPKKEENQPKTLHVPCDPESVKSKEESNENVVKTFSIAIKRKKYKNKKTNQSAENVETILHEQHPEIPNTTTNEMDNNDTLSKLKNEESDKSSILSTVVPKATATGIKNDTTLYKVNNEDKSSSLLSASTNTLVDTSNYSSTNCSDESVDKKLKGKKVRKKKSTSISSEDTNAIGNIPSCKQTKVNAKKPTKRKRTQILDSSKSSEEGEVTCNRSNQVKKALTNGSDDKEKTLETKDEGLNVIKKKKKLKQNSTTINSDGVSQPIVTDTHVEAECHNTSIRNDGGIELKNNLALDPNALPSNDSQKPKKKRNKKVTPNRTDNLCEGRDVLEKSSPPSKLQSLNTSSEILEELNSSSVTGKNVDEHCQFPNNPANSFHGENSEDSCVNTKLNNSTDCPLNQSLSGEDAKEQDSYKHKKPKRPRKRKLSKSSDTKSGEVQLKKSKQILENSSQSCDISSSPATEKNLYDPTKQTPENSKSVELTPTHHKIFLNDVFPNDSPPVYNGHDDDIQYQEIDNRLRSMFQSPSYTQTTVEECSFEKKTDNIPIRNMNVSIEETIIQNEMEPANQTTITEIDETLNQSDRSHCDTSISSRKVSLGSNEYEIQSVGSHTANVFITRKRTKKRTKANTTAV